MPRSHAGRAAALLTAVALVAAPAAAAAQSPAASAAAPDRAAIARARADSARIPWVAADARFMTGMIGHHAQAIEMARLAPTHGASPAVRTLAARIINAQRDEIATMQQWLRDREQPVPEPAALRDSAAAAESHDAHAGHGDPHAGHAAMPGMLTPAQMQALAAARGEEFDRQFLTLMIQHHKGAVAMVETLFATDGAAQNETVFKLASDVNVDQITEIARMQDMLAALMFGTTAP
ncbi:DUF305 domain-containing protein [Roseisolibacter agri]|uniref:DUF305 domain-containing protein n=1 Tax=Roseisolibacter agri TaxID=2014610 RepID=A0AA37QCL4_9BACT|nr:DUF305 domain-containing protein [Roseisolibacter agri]GLC27827.1 hypothetical protein rosag_43400 [Roseisolibacter agri]